MRHLGGGDRPITLTESMNSDPSVPPEVSEYELGRVYFVVSSKHDEAALSIRHYPMRQGLLLPVYPLSAVEDALPLLYEDTARYAAQWPKIMVEDLDRDAKGFSLPGELMPSGIAPMENAPALLAIARDHAPTGSEAEAWLQDAEVRVLWDNIWVLESNTKDFAHEAEVINEHGIDL